MRIQGDGFFESSFEILLKIKYNPFTETMLKFVRLSTELIPVLYVLALVKNFLVLGN